MLFLFFEEYIQITIYLFTVFFNCKLFKIKQSPWAQTIMDIHTEPMGGQANTVSYVALEDIKHTHTKTQAHTRRECMHSRIACTDRAGRPSARVLATHMSISNSSLLASDWPWLLWCWRASPAYGLASKGLRGGRGGGY